MPDLYAVKDIVLPICGHCHSENIGAKRLSGYGLQKDHYSKAVGSHNVAVYICNGCGMPVTALGSINEANDLFIIRRFLPVPDLKEISDDLPARAKRYLEQAVGTLPHPDASVMACASAIDAMLKDKGYVDGSLYVRIEHAAKDHLITEGMKEWAHHIRLEGNKPRHADIEDPHMTPEDAKNCVAFAEALGQFMFVLPAQVAKGKKEADPESNG